MLSLFKLFQGSAGKRKEELRDSKNEFCFKFKETDNEFLDIALMGKSKNLKKEQSKSSTAVHTVACDPNAKSGEDEVDISVGEMIQFQAQVSGKRPDDKHNLVLQQKMERIRAGHYNKNLDELVLHKMTYHDEPLDTFEEEKFDPRLTRKIKADRRRAKNLFFS